MGKHLYVTVDGKVAVIAKSKYEALYKASVATGRVIEWTEMRERAAYMPNYVREVLTDIANKGVIVGEGM